MGSTKKSQAAYARVLTVVALTAGCGLGGEATPPPKAPLPPAAPSPSGSASAPAGAPGPGDWQTWTPAQKEAWMKSGVLPRMHSLFASLDASKYGEMTCKTCHGTGAIQGDFKMPNPDLPKLDPKPAAFKTLEQTNPRMFTFMATQVEPTMASLLAVQPHDMKTNKGFGCFNCHTEK
jgi:hypothetical protein